MSVVFGGGGVVLVLYVLTLPVMLSLCLETALRALVLGRVAWVPPSLVTADTLLVWVAAILFFFVQAQVGRGVLLARALTHAPALRAAWRHRNDTPTVRERDAVRAQAYTCWKNTERVCLYVCVRGGVWVRAVLGLDECQQTLFMWPPLLTD
jgi:hypothetical protein